MTTELVLLLAVFAFVLGGVFFNQKNGPLATFQNSGPRLGARLEEQAAIGRAFKVENGHPQEWVTPSSQPPTGQL